jgi:[ribosomal protein S5]-alanine N-acetyltransferase
MGIGPTATLEESRARLERALGFQSHLGYTLWAVAHSETGELLGQCGLVPLDGSGPEVELGYRLATAHWGRGYATEAAAACRDLGFARFGLERIYVDVHPDNEASKGVAHKLGAQLLGPAEHGGFHVLRFAIHRGPR